MIILQERPSPQRHNHQTARPIQKTANVCLRPMQNQKTMRQQRRQINSQRRHNQSFQRLRPIPASNTTKRLGTNSEMERNERQRSRQRNECPSRARFGNIQTHIWRRVSNIGHGSAPFPTWLDDFASHARASFVRSSIGGHVRHSSFPRRFNAQASRHH